MTDKLKFCPRCRDYKRPDQFHRKTSAPDGRQGHCKLCHKRYDRLNKAQTRHRFLGVRPLAEWEAERRASADQVLAAVRVAVRRLWAETGRPPTLPEVARASGLGHPASVLPYLARLEAAGEVERDAPGGHLRTIWPAGLRSHIRAHLADS